jgi:hypothetical protein
MNRTLARRAPETYVPASAEKIGAASPFTVLPKSGVSGIITDAAPHPPVARLDDPRQLNAAGLPDVI